MARAVVRYVAKPTESVSDYVWTSTTQITMPASSILIGTGGNSDDAQLYTAGSLVFSFANGTGDNGVDVGGTATGYAWYALYAVPSSTVSGQYVLKATLRNPITQPGPSGYTKYRYLGLFKLAQYVNTANSTDIAQFVKSGPMLNFYNNQNANADGLRMISSSGPTTTVSSTTSVSYTMTPSTNVVGIPFDGALYGWTLGSAPATPSAVMFSINANFQNGVNSWTGQITMSAGNNNNSNNTQGFVWMDSAKVTQIALTTGLALSSGNANFSLNLNTVWDPILMKMVKS